MPLPTGSPAPPDAPGGPVLLAFFKDTCPVCVMAFPVVSELARRYGDTVPVVAVAQDPPDRADPWLAEHGFPGGVIDDSGGYPLSDAFGVSTVPTLVLVDGGTVEAVSEGWDRDRYNRWDADLAARSGRPSVGPVTTADDGRPVFKPG